jgi:hypothetical protein
MIAFSRTLLGLHDCLWIESWVEHSISQLEDASNEEELMDLLWPVLKKNIKNNVFQKCRPAESLKKLAHGWINDTPYYELFDLLSGDNCKIGNGTKPYKISIEHIIEICENGFAYDGMLTVGSIVEIVKILRPANKALLKNLTILQKRLKYGLKEMQSLQLYEWGFCDRIIASNLGRIMGVPNNGEFLTNNDLKKKKSEILNEITNYPSYYENIMKRLINKQ